MTRADRRMGTVSFFQPLDLDRRRPPREGRPWRANRAAGSGLEEGGPGAAPLIFGSQGRGRQDDPPALRRPEADLALEEGREPRLIGVEPGARHRARREAAVR